MAYEVGRLLEDWRGKRVRVTTVDNERLDGELHDIDIGRSFFVLLHNNVPVLVRLSALITMRPYETSD